MAHVHRGVDGGKGKHIYFPSLIENVFDRSSDMSEFWWIIMRFKLSGKPFMSGEGGFYALKLSGAQT